MIFSTKSLLLLLLSSSSLAFAASISSTPKAQLGSGVAIGSTSNGIDSWKGIPYAQSPVGSLRLLPPREAKAFTGSQYFVKDPDSCFNVNSTAMIASSLSESQGSELAQLLGEVATTEIQMNAAANNNNSTATQSEDCLYLNVYRPEGTSSKAKLPVVIWVYGGSFTSSDITEYRPQNFLKRSIELNEPVIFVEMNYRLGAYGFLSGSDVVKQNATNVGLLDQRLAFEWVHKNIESFGGSKDKVTLWGESAGAISLGLHLVSYGKTSSDGLYRATIFESGAPFRIVNSSNDFAFSQLTELSGCDSQSDKFKCLQELSTADFNTAMNAVVAPSSTSLSFSPVVDGTFIPAYPDELVRSGRFARDVAVLSGNEEDEGTGLTLSAIRNITSEAGFDYYLHQSIPGLTEAQYSGIKSLYPADPSAGSPYNTGNKYNITGFNKRVASVVGDYVFQGPRRSLMSKIAESKNCGLFGFLHATFKSTPLLGAYHSSELANTFGWINGSISDEMTARWIGFINHQTPDAKGYLKFPSYTNDKKKLLYFGEETSKVIEDDFRRKQTDYFEDILKNLK